MANTDSHSVPLACSYALFRVGLFAALFTEQKKQHTLYDIKLCCLLHTATLVHS